MQDLILELSTPRTLTQRQIAWCRANIKSFEDAWWSVQKADAHRARVYESLGLELGALPAIQELDTRERLPEVAALPVSVRP